MDEIFRTFARDRAALVPLLQAVQERLGHVPPSLLPRIADHLRVSEGEIYGVLRFYKSFRLRPRGRTAFTVCLGTACHVRGGSTLSHLYQRLLGIPAGGTTPDGAFSLETVACLGCCALSPVVVVNGVYHAKVTLPRAVRLLKMHGWTGR